jgi:hypothetical protein
VRLDGSASLNSDLGDKAVNEAAIGEAAIGEAVFSETAVGTRTPVSGQRELCQQ